VIEEVTHNFYETVLPSNPYYNIYKLAPVFPKHNSGAAELTQFLADFMV
jgi:truncated hemoglobin YjbI